jgi:hypothetical protein
MDKSKLLSKRIRTVEVPIGEDGETVTIRSLSREQALHIANKKMEMDVAERYVLSRALVDPELSEADVKTWQENSEAGEIQVVFEAVTRLSGLTKDAGKDAYKSASE